MEGALGTHRSLPGAVGMEGIAAAGIALFEGYGATIRGGDAAVSDKEKRGSDWAQRLNGPWYNQPGSCLDVTVDQAGRLAGTFQSLVGGFALNTR
jgi:hypothetical protein